MLGIASIDGVLSPLHEARISVLDRAFQFGDAVFEALRTYGKKGDALEQHVTRLEQSCARLHITIGISRAELIAEIERAIDALPSPEGYVRIMITRGELPESLAPMMPGGPAPARRRRRERQAPRRLDGVCRPPWTTR